MSRRFRYNLLSNTFQITNATLSNVVYDNATFGNLNATALLTGVASNYSGSFSASNNISSPSPVTGLSFDNSATRSFEALVSVTVTRSSGGNLYETMTLEAQQNDSGWTLLTSSFGDTSGVAFTISNDGVVRYTSTDQPNWLTTIIRFNVTQISSTSSYSVLTQFTTGGTAVIDSLQLNNTSGVTLGVNNGALYSQGGGLFEKGITIRNTDDVVGFGSGGSLSLFGGAVVGQSLLVGNTISSSVVSAGSLLAYSITTGSLSAANISASAATISSLLSTNASLGTLLATSSVSTGQLSATGSSLGTLHAVGVTTGTLLATSSINSASLSTGQLSIINASAANLLVTGAITAPSTVVTNAIIGSQTSSNILTTNISTGTLNVSTGITSGSAQIGTALITNINNTNISSATLNLSTGITSGSAQIGTALITNINNTNITTATLNVSTAITSANALITSLNSGAVNTVGSMITTGGNIGIGTATPQAKLDVNGGNIHLNVMPGLFSTGKIRLGRSDNSAVRFSEIEVANSSVAADNYIGFNVHSTASASTASRVLTLVGNGNVGIANTSPTFLLDINGTARATTITGATLAMTNATATNIVSTSITSASALVTNVSTTNISSSAITSATLNVSVGITTTNLRSTDITSGTLNLTTGITSGTAQIGTAFITGGTVTNLLTTSVTSSTLNLTTGITSAAGFLTGGTITNLMTTNITTTNLRSTTAIVNGGLTLFNSSGAVRKFSSAINTTISAGNLYLLGVLTNGNAHNVTLRGVINNIHDAAGETDFHVFARRNGATAGSMSYQFTQTQRNMLSNVRIRLFRDDNNFGTSYVCFEVGSTVFSFGWDVTVLERNNNNAFTNTTTATVLDTAGMTEIEMNTSRYIYNSSITITGGSLGVGTTSPSYSLDVVGGGRISGELTTGSTLISNGSLTVGSGGHLVVPGFGTFGSLLVSSGTLRLTGTSTLGSTLISNGNLTVGSGGHLVVTGTNTLGSTLISNGNLTVGSGGHLVVPGFGTFGSLLVSSGTFRLTGTSTLGSTLISNGTLTVGSGGYLVVTGTNTIGNIFTTGGNVGIGTSSPDSLLHIGTLSQQGGLSITGNTDGTNGAYIYLSGETNGFLIKLHEQSRVRIESNESINFNNGQMTLATSGNVGIGTTAPTSQLEMFSNSNTDLYLNINTTDDRLVTVNTWNPNSDFSIGVNPSTQDNASAFIWQFDNRDIRIGTNNTERMRITNTGNVGIGTSNPSSALHVNGQAFVYNGSTGSPTTGTLGGTGTRVVLWPGDGSNHPYAMGINNGQQWYGVPTTARHAFFTGGTERMTITSRGNVGIGTSSPSYPLHISSTAGSGTITSRFFNVGADNTGSTSSSTHTVSLYCQNGGVWVDNGSSFIASSDKRIKTNVIDITSEHAISTIMKLNPITYSFIDVINNGNKITKGFIAQDVEECLPEAVSNQRNFIPNIFTKITFSRNTDSGFHPRTKNACASETFSGQIPIEVTSKWDTKAIAELEHAKKLKCFDQNGTEIILDILNVTTEKATHHGPPIFSLQVFSTGSELLQDSQHQTLFVYGIQVDDFKTLEDKPLLAISIAALKSLITQNEYQNTRINELTQRIKQIEELLSTASLIS